MKNKNAYSDTNTPEILTYSVVGGMICLCCIPQYIPHAICYGVIFISLYGIGKILGESKEANQMDFISKENIKYFNNRE